MKTSSVTMIVSLILCQAYGQRIDNKDISSNIKDALLKNYNVKNARWEKEENGFEASFKQKGKEVSVVFDASGEVIKTENEINKTELPSYVIDIIQKEFSGFKIEEAARIDSKGAVLYEAEVRNGNESFELIFNEEKLIRKTAEKSWNKD